MNFKQWLEDLGHSKNPPYMPRTQNGLIGNELKTDAGQVHKDAFPQSNNDFQSSKIDMPTGGNGTKKGLGELGLKSIGEKTFKAGENPTISRGIPLTNLKGQFS